MKLRFQTAIVLMMACASGTLLFCTSQAVQDAERSLSTMRAEQEAQQEEIVVLEAERAFLSTPERLEALAKKYLNLSDGQAKFIPSVAMLRPPPADEILLHDASLQGQAQ